jgi:hypothetical protein
MASKKILETFNTQLMKFFAELCKLYPDNRDFKAIKGQIRTGLNLDKKLAVKMFHEYVVKEFKEKILQKDEEFFLNFDVSGTDLESLNYIKNIWRDANEDVKNAVYKYILLLTRLCDKYFS